ncbi:MAG: hypothetical protein AB7K37_05635 [Cyclobacteriaceae bacterium]
MMPTSPESFDDSIKRVGKLKENLASAEKKLASLEEKYLPNENRT